MVASPLNFKIFVLLLTSLMLTQCIKGTKTPTTIQSQSTHYPYLLPAADYLALAKNEEGIERQNYQILAAGRLIYQEKWHDGLRLLKQLKYLPASQQAKRTVLLAKVDLLRAQPNSAITKLATIKAIERLPPFYQVQYHELLARAFEGIGKVAEAVTERIKLDPLLQKKEAQTENRRTLWLALTKLPSAELNTLAMESKENSEFAGWMTLAQIERQPVGNGMQLLTQINKWQNEYPNHAAKSLLPVSLSTIKSNLYKTPQQIALLLPLSGSIGGPGNAVRDGFIAAASRFGFVEKIHTYDTASNDISKIYHQALDEGADYVVGPLTKTEVAKIASLQHPVPTFFLNDMAVPRQPNTFHFGLSFTNEAKEVAIKAGIDGTTRALVISPSGSWAEDIVEAFNSQWQAQGGFIVDRLIYSESNLDREMRNFLGISESQIREKRLKQLLGKDLQTIPQRRQDFDMIFLLAYPSKARQIMPLLKYYFAGDVPVYSLSTVYTGTRDAMKDRDLDGIVFCDMPWVFFEQSGHKNWPEQLNSYNRLYALGMDSFALIMQFNHLLLFPATQVTSKSALQLNTEQQITRIPVWGKFKQGIATVLG